MLHPGAFDTQLSEALRMPENSDFTGTLQINVSHDGPSARLGFVGEFDLSGIDRAREKLMTVAQDGATEIVIDLRELTFIDSSGIAFLLGAVKEAEGQRLTFVPSESPAVRRVLDITGVDRLFGGDGDSAPAGAA